MLNPPPTLPVASGITVYSAAPGSGKTRAAQELIAQSFREGALQRVVWAVHSTLKKDGLGDEARRAFQQLGVRATIIQGKKHTSSQEYRRQMQWGSTPEVKIISHAHLPYVFDRHPTLASMAPELLVIDECPLNALILKISLSLWELQKLGEAGGLLVTLRDMAVACNQAPGLPATTTHFSDHTRQEHMHYFTGAPFLQAMQAGAKPGDSVVLAEAIMQLRSTGADYIDASLLDVWRDALQADLANPDQGSHRFGLRWRTHKNFTEVQPEFYSSVRIPLNLPPTLILDAYSYKPLYQALFREHSVTFQSGGDPQPLVVEHAKDLRVRKETLRRPNSHAHLLQIAEEIVTLQLQEGRPVSILADLALHRPESPWRRAVEAAQSNLGPAVLESLHHHAGRGINGHKGNILVALTLAQLPRSVENCDLAALFPYCDVKRKKAYQHLLRSERLQMFSRNRQLQTGARIISAFDPKLSPEWCTVKTYKPILRFKKKSNNPRRLTALQTVVEELTELGGGIPRSALAALGLVIGDSAPDKIALHAEALRTFLRSQALDHTPVLRSWLHDDHLGRFQGVQPYRKKSNEPATFLRGLGFDSSAHNHIAYHDGQLLRTQIWVRPGVDETAVLKIFYPKSKP